MLDVRCWMLVGAAFCSGAGSNQHPKSNIQHPLSTCLSTAGPDQLPEHGRVQIAETFEPDAAPADAGFGERLLVMIGNITGSVAWADIQRSVVLVAGDADAEPVTFTSPGVLVVIGAICEHAAVD